MSIILIIVGVIGLFALGAAGIVEPACYLTHLDMVQSHAEKWAWGSFKDFKRMYAKRTWEKHNKHSTSWFQSYSSPDYGDWYIHADIIIFDGIGMKLYPWSYIAFQIWSHKNKDPKASIPSNHISHEWK